MTLLFGLFSPSGERVPEGLLDRVEAHCDWPRDRTLRYEAPGLALLTLQRDTVPRVGQPRILHDDGTALLFDGRIDNREELAARCGLGHADSLDDEELVHAAWRAEGPDLCRVLVGDFAFALHDPASNRLILGRDHLGVTPLYHAQAGPFAAFSSALASLLHVPGIDRAWDERWIADLLIAAKVDVESTAYGAIRAVAPAHTLTVDAAGMHKTRYWTLTTAESPLDIDDDEAIAEYGRLFDEAVRCRLRAPGEVACELSGGLDSSAIAATAVPLLGSHQGRLLAFSHGVPEDHPDLLGTALDERPYVDAMRAALPEMEHRWTSDAVDSLLPLIESVVAHHGAPERNDINAFTRDLPETLRARGVRVLLSGFGGDQMATSAGIGYTESLLAERDWATLRELMQARHGTLGGGLRWALYRSGIGAIGVGRRAELAVRRRYTEFAPLARTEFLDRMERADTVERRQHRALSGTMRAREAVGIASPAIAYRLQDSATGAGPRGFAYRYPMLDIRLLTFVHNLPTRIKRTPTMPRRLIRKAMRGRLPDKVRLRTGKDGSTSPEIMLNAVAHAGELAQVISAGRADPRLASYARFDLALETLERAGAAGEFVGPLSTRHVLRLATLSLWAKSESTFSLANEPHQLKTVLSQNRGIP